MSGKGSKGVRATAFRLARRRDRERERERTGVHTYQAALAHNLGFAVADLRHENVNARLECCVLDHIHDALVNEPAHHLVGHLNAVKDEGKRVAQKMPHVIPYYLRQTHQKGTRVANLLRTKVCNHILDRLLQQAKYTHAQNVLHICVLLIPTHQLRKGENRLVPNFPKFVVRLEDEGALLLHLSLDAARFRCKRHPVGPSVLLQDQGEFEFLEYFLLPCCPVDRLYVFTVKAELPRFALYVDFSVAGASARDSLRVCVNKGIKGMAAEACV